MKQLKKLSAIAAAKQKAERNHELVLVMLEWDEQTLQALFIDSALDYLSRQCGPDLEGIRRLREGDMFWPWFQNHWNKLDAAFIDDCLGEHDLNDVRAYYKYKHSGCNMRFKPHKAMMTKSYAKEVAA